MIRILKFCSTEKHNTTEHTCCVFDDQDACVYSCVMPKKQDIVVAAFLGRILYDEKTSYLT